MQEISEDMKELSESQYAALSGLYPLLMLVRDAIKQCNEDYQRLDEDRFHWEVPKDLVEFCQTWLNLTQASSLLAIFKKFLKQLQKNTSPPARKPEISMDGVFQEVKNLHIFEKHLDSKTFSKQKALAVKSIRKA